MVDGTDALASAIFQRIKAALANVTLIGIAGPTTVPLFDDAPEREGDEAAGPFPRVEVGETDVGDWGTKTSFGTEQNITLTVYTNYRGRKQARQIAAYIYDSLHEQDFAVDGQDLILIRFENADYDRAGDGKVYFGRLRYRALLDALSDAESD
jgi:hypothetical protein